MLQFTKRSLAAIAARRTVYLAGAQRTVSGVAGRELIVVPNDGHRNDPNSQQCTGNADFCKGTCSGSSDILLSQIELKASKAIELHRSNDKFAQTQLRELKFGKSPELNIGKLLLKDEGSRMGLKAFKGLGVAFATDQLFKRNHRDHGTNPVTLCTMTDGNHGRAVAHVAKSVGCEAVIYVPHDMVQARKDAIEAEGATVIVVDGSYDDAIDTVKVDAVEKGWHLVCDTAWPGYTDVPMDIMVGYTTIFREVEEQHTSADPITHVVLQAGVGGFAAAGAAWISLRKHISSVWADDLKIIIVEPEDAACVLENVQGGVVKADDLKMCKGKTESLMSGLNCGLPSMLAWPILRDAADVFVAIGDEWAKDAVREIYHQDGVVVGESGAAGVAALLALHNQNSEFAPGSSSTVLCISTEADTDPIGWQTIVNEDVTKTFTPSFAAKPDVTLGFVQIASDMTLDMDAPPLLSQIPNVSWRNTKMALPSESISSDTYESAIKNKNIQFAASSFLPAQADTYGNIDVMAMACTSLSFVLGSSVVQHELREGYPTAEYHTDMATAVVKALRQVTRDKHNPKLALVTPYLDEVHSKNKRFLEENGFTIVADLNLGLEKDSETSAVTPRSIADAVEYVLSVAHNKEDAEDVDVVFIGCSAFRSTDFGFIDSVEDSVGLPVITSNQALLWHCLKSGGISDMKLNNVNGYGKLFSSE